MNFGDEALDWLRCAIGAAGQPLDIVQLKGSTSSSIFLIEHMRGAAPERFVLRVLDNREWLADEPDLAEHEAAALDEAQTAGLRAPRLVAYASDDIGFGAPVVLMSFLDGGIELRPPNFRHWLVDLAGELAAIHRHTAPAFGWRFRSWINWTALAVPAWTSKPLIWERAIERVRGAAPTFRPIFIHRDYHPTNVLWRDGAVSGVVDWINACQGPAGVDVAHCRTNLTTMYGPAIADQFLAQYLAVADDFEYDPYWDIDSVLDMCLPQPIFYSPWLDFGLAPLAQSEIQHRIDTYLERVLTFPASTSSKNRNTAALTAAAASMLLA